MNEEYIKKVPFSLEAEQAVLGSILRKPDCMDNIVGTLNSDDFYLTEHKEIFKAMEGMYLKSRSIDVLTLIDELVKSGVYTEAGGKEYINLIFDVVPTASNFEDYAAIVRDKSIARQIISACDDISSDAYAEKYNSQELIEKAEDKIYRISDSRENHDFIHIKDALIQSFNRLKEIKSNEFVGMQTGFSGIDRVIVGMSKGDFVLVGARPGMGKTSFVMNVAVNAAMRSPKKVCIFSLEMSAEQLATRLLASEALVDSTRLRSGQLDKDEWERLGHAASRLANCNILIDDSTASTVSSMKAKLRRTDDIGLVIIDYLGLMKGEKEDMRKSDNKANEVAGISRNLKLMAKDLGIPVLTCAQLNRDTEKRTGAANHRPTLSDFRDSGAIEQDADIVLLIYRPGEYDKEDPEKQNQAEIIIAKNRHGSQDTIKMGWQKQFTKFITLDDRMQE